MWCCDPFLGQESETRQFSRCSQRNGAPRSAPNCGIQAVTRFLLILAVLTCQPPGQANAFKELAVPARFVSADDSNPFENRSELGNHGTASLNDLHRSGLFDDARSAATLTPPILSLAAGYYSDPQVVVAWHPESHDVVIRYTLDGSEPGPDSPAITGPIPIQPRLNEPNIFSSIKTTAGNDFWQEPRYDVPKATVLRVRAFSLHNQLPSPTITRTYFVGSHLQPHDAFPVLSIVTDGEHLFDEQTGIYVAGSAYDGNWEDSNFWQRGREWERPVHLELFEPDGRLGLAQDAGVRIHGGWSRRWAYKSLRFYARTEYGASAFPHRIFPDQPYESYRRFITRNSGADYDVTLFRDAFLQRLVAHMQFDTQAYRPAILFINGEYWGIQNLRERYDRHYLHRVYGVDPDQIDLLTNDREIRAGSTTHYDELLQIVADTPMDQPEALHAIRTRMDLDNFIDYNIAHIFLNNTDWPGNNVDFWRLRTDAFQPDAPYGHDGRWRWMIVDTDFGFWLYHGAGPEQSRDDPSHNALAFATEPGGSSWPNPDWATFLLRSLLQNEPFRVAFINRFADQLNTAFRPYRSVALINEMAAALEPEMAQHIQRFGRPASVETWRANVDRMRRFATDRPHYQAQHIRTHFELPGTYHLTVNVNHSDHGRVRVHSLLIDPATPGVPHQPYPWTGSYFHGIPLEIEAIPNHGYRFVHWLSHGLPTSGSLSITLNPDPSDPDGNHIRLTAVFEPAPDPISFHDWMQAHGFSHADLANPELAAPCADPDRDGIPNLLEYAFDGNPRMPHTSTMPALDITPTGVDLVFPQDPAKTDLIWIVESSVDLSNWTGLRHDVGSHAIDPSYQPVARIPISTSDSPAKTPYRFLRVRVLLLNF